MKRPISGGIAMKTLPLAARTRCSALLLAAPLLLLSACTRAAPPAQGRVSSPPTPAAAGRVDTPAPGEALPQARLLSPLGLMRLTFSNIGGENASVSAEGLPGGLSGQTLSSTGGIQLQPVSTGSFVLGTRGAGGVRYLYATFKVRNANAAGTTAYATPRTNLTLLAVSTPASVNATALSSILKFDGTPADPATAPTIVPTHAMTFDRASEKAVLLGGGEDLQVYSEGEAADLGLPSGVTRVFPYGFVVRNPATPSSRTLPASPAAGVFSGEVTIALKLPLQASAADDPFSFSLNVEAVDDSVARVTESVEEQGAGSGAATRASALGAGTQLATLCGTSYSGANDVFVGSATTAGGAGFDRQAHIGGNLALSAVLLPYPQVGNTASSVPAASGLLSNYAAYPPAPGGPATTLSAASSAGSTPGSILNVNSDGSFRFTPKAGEGSGNTDTIGYTVSDGAGCTSPALSVSAPISGRVWYAKNDVSNGSGDGRSINPFRMFSAAVSASSAGDTLYVYRGDGSISNQNTDVVLKANQRLIGSGTPLTLGAATLLPQDLAGAPLLGGGLLLATNNELGGFGLSNLRPNGASGITGVNFGTLQSSAVSVAVNGSPALDLRGGVLAASFTSLSSSNSGSHGLNLDNTSGSLAVTGDGATAGSGGVISGAAINGVNVGPTSPGQPTLPTIAPSLSLSWMTIKSSKLNGARYEVPSTSSAATALTLAHNALTDNGSTHLQVNLNGTGSATFSITDNTFSNPLTGIVSGIEVNSNHTGTAPTQGRINTNTMTLRPDSQGVTSTNGVAIYVNGAGTSSVQINANTIKNYSLYGIDLAAQQGSGTLNATLSGNQISMASAPGGLEGMRLNAGNAGAGESSTLCLNLLNNTSAGAGGPGLGGYVVSQRPNTTYQLQGYTGGASDAAAVAAFIKSRDAGSNGARVRSTSPRIANFSAATCAVPTF